MAAVILGNFKLCTECAQLVLPLQELVYPQFVCWLARALLFLRNPPLVRTGCKRALTSRWQLLCEPTNMLMLAFHLWALLHPAAPYLSPQSDSFQSEAVFYTQTAMAAIALVTLSTTDQQQEAELFRFASCCYTQHELRVVVFVVAELTFNLLRHWWSCDNWSKIVIKVCFPGNSLQPANQQLLGAAAVPTSPRRGRQRPAPKNPFRSWCQRRCWWFH